MDARISEAINKVDNFDFFWRMEDGNYSRNYQRAEQGMKAFVKMVSEIPSFTVREALRSLWILNFEDARARISGSSITDYKAQREQLMTVLA